jgi:hypothetical protein
MAAGVVEARARARLEVKRLEAAVDSTSARASALAGRAAQSPPANHMAEASRGSVVVVKQYMPWDGLNRGRTRYWRIRERGTS